MEKEIIQLVEEKGPLTGAEILSAIKQDELRLWRACRLSENLSVQNIGQRYLRLDRQIEGFARLSPSILREFLTYTVIGRRSDPLALRRKADTIASHTREKSRAKAELARSVLLALLSQLEDDVPINQHVCFILAGDIVYDMAHDAPRPERSTGKLVKGSDIDLVVVADDRFPKELLERIDDAIYQEKQTLLMTPHLRQEIDYIVKDLDRVRVQMEFDTFKHIVACKILQEGILLCGNRDLFNTIKAMLREKGVTEKLKRLENQAVIFRKDAETYLLADDPGKIKKEILYYFYPSEETEEFE